MKQDEGGVRAEYIYTMNISKSGSVYTGTTYVQYVDKPDIYGVMEFSGMLISDGQFAFKEKGIIRQNEDKNMYWCVKQGILAYSEEGDSAVLSGKWESWNPPSCAPGTVVLKKPLHQKQANAISESEPEITPAEIKEPYNKPEIVPKKDEAKIINEMKTRKPKLTEVQSIEIGEKIFFIEIYDHGFIDGDTISLFFNDKPILVKYGLTKEHRRIELSYNTSLSQNKLLLHAHNLGTSPPNSAAILIFADESVQKVSLLSDLNESGLILIKLKK